MQSKAATVSEYLASLPAERRPAIEAVRDVILKNLDPTFEEGMQYGMIGYYVPHRNYPAGYHCDPRQPLPYVCLASQKNYMSLYMMSLYIEAGADGKSLYRWFIDAWKKTGKKLDMGKSCIRFKKLDDLPLDVIGEAIRRVPADKHIAFYEAILMKMKTSKPKRAKPAAKPKASRKSTARK